ncbi:MAG: hypothetical protein EPN72_11610 [Nevskiaceae bacterium]|nr:MAG: hypothetical protein EPN63_01370 [Nevskiaceae bacterium]TBR71840.1 MAG: hypothetical protein EPN72_11610 [Nevskiaceae bacterium]
MNTRVLLLLTLLCLLGARGLGVHLHNIASPVQALQTHTVAASHLAHYGEDGDASQAAEIDLIGQNLNTIFMPALFVVAAFLVLLLVLPLAVRQRLPRAPICLGARARLAFRLCPPSQAPPY